MKNLTASFLNKILCHIPEPVFVKDSQYNWVYVNDALCKFTGFAYKDLIGKTDFDFFPEKEALVFQEKDKLVFETEKENINEESLTDANGVRHIISTKKSILKDEQGNKYLIGVIHDISEKRILLKAYEKNNLLLESYAKAVAHDFKTPVRIINSFAQILKQTANSNLSENEHQYLGYIYDGASTLQKLLDSTLEFTEVQNNKLQLEFLSIAEILEELKAEMHQNFEITDDSFHISNTINGLKCDRQKIKKLFENLLVNAIKFRKKEEELKVTIDSIEQKDAFIFSVSDNGIGISALQNTKALV